MNTTIKNQTFGVEIEMTGITRENAAKVIAKFFGTEAQHLISNVYDIWGAEDNEGRTWKLMRDGSIDCVDETGRNVWCGEYSCEMVTPILRYEDLETLKKIMSLLVKKGAVANSSTGIHVHVSAEAHTAKTLQTLLDLAVEREGLLYEALQITRSRENQWCHKINKNLAEKAHEANSLSQLANIWYSRVNDGGDSRRTIHYNSTRYHGVNLHSLFTGKGVEFRYFNGTTDGKKIEAYVQLCLGINAYAINNPEVKIRTIKACETNKQKRDQMWQFLFDMQMPTREYFNLHKQLKTVWAQ